MSPRAFKTGVERAFLSMGFERHGRSLRRRGLSVWTLVGAEKGLGKQWHVNVGFWLEALGARCPEQVERTHLYFRLERLFPEQRDAIASAGALDDLKQPEAFARLKVLVQDEIESELRWLGTEAGLRSALETGRLAQGLIRREAREYLKSTSSGELCP